MVTQKLTLDDYLVLERAAFERSEYWRGETHHMPGMTERHNLLCGNLSYFLQTRLDGTGSRVFTSNMKVGIGHGRAFAYPDLSVTRGDRFFYDKVRDVLTNPTVIFEVLSDSTRSFDQGEKFLEYQRLDSLRHYVLIEQSERLVIHYERSSEGRWTYEALTGPGVAVNLTALGIELPLDEIYHEITLAQPEQLD
jgi:Uma2 family endonuclease